MILGSMCQTTPKGPEDTSTVLLRRTLEITWCPTMCWDGRSWLGTEQVFIFLYQPLWTCLVLQELIVIEQDSFCSLNFVHVTHVLLLSGSPWYEVPLVTVFRRNSTKLSVVVPVHVRGKAGSPQKWGYWLHRLSA